MPTRVYQWALYALLLAFVVGCGGTTNPGGDGDGGDGGDGGGNDGGSGDNGNTPPTLVLTASSPQLPSAAASPLNDPGNNAVVLTAELTDANGDPLTDAPVAFTVAQGASSTINCDVLVDNDRNDNKATVYTGCDPTERVIEIKATGANLSDTYTIEVVGTKLTLLGPTKLLPGDDNVQYTAALLNSAGTGIDGELIGITTDGQLTSPGSGNVQTDSDGEIQFTVDAKVSEGPGIITVRALGGTETATLSVAVDNQSFQFIEPETNERTGLPVNTPVALAVMLKNQNGPVSGRDVTFSTNRGTFGNGSFEQTVTTDAAGEAIVELTAQFVGQAIIRADAKPASGPNAPANGPNTRVTLEFIAVVPAALGLTADPPVIPSNGETTLIAEVTDANGNPVTGATVRFINQSAGGRLPITPVTTNKLGITTATYKATPQTGGEAIVKAVIPGTPISQTQTITISDNAIQITLGTDNVVHGAIVDNDDAGNGSTGSGSGSGSGNDTGNNQGNANSDNPSGHAEYRVHYVANVTGADHQPADDTRVELVSTALLAFQEGEKQLQSGSNVWEPAYTAPQNTAGFGCSPNAPAPATPNNPVQMTNLEKTAIGQWEFDVTYPQNFSGWARVALEVRAERTNDATISDTDSVALTLAMADADINDANSTPPGKMSPYGTDGDCTTLQ